MEYTHPEFLETESDLSFLLDVEGLELLLTQTQLCHHHPAKLWNWQRSNNTFPLQLSLASFHTPIPCPTRIHNSEDKWEAESQCRTHLSPLPGNCGSSLSHQEWPPRSPQPMSMENAPQHLLTAWIGGWRGKGVSRKAAGSPSSLFWTTHCHNYTIKATSAYAKHLLCSPLHHFVWVHTRMVFHPCHLMLNSSSRTASGKNNIPLKNPKQICIKCSFQNHTIHVYNVTTDHLSQVTPHLNIYCTSWCAQVTLCHTNCIRAVFAEWNSQEIFCTGWQDQICTGGTYNLLSSGCGYMFSISLSLPQKPICPSICTVKPPKYILILPGRGTQRMGTLSSVKDSL